MIPRIQLFEFEDLKKCPEILRNYLTDFLEHIAVRFRFYDDLIPVLIKTLHHYEPLHLVDIGSGGGGGMFAIYQALHPRFDSLKITLTDLYPNIDAFEKQQRRSNGAIHFEADSVNATNVPKRLSGFRTLFRSFHHFDPQLGKAVLQDAIDKKQPIGIFEIQERSLSFLLFFAIISPLLVILMTPFIKPFSIKRLFFTYFLPVVPFIVLWDGTITVLRTYTPEELRIMVRELENSDDFHWEIGKVGAGVKMVSFLIGKPNTA
ncbi:hypothetical protein [Maribacter sp. 2-571]|uniref:hypothetical protein n=1 Tax=Maribacter sp. 2-571 TaxID=3417569 RepID=UPI003D3309DB